MNPNLKLAQHLLSFPEFFQDSIDMTDGSITMTEREYKQIQLNAIAHGMTLAAGIVNDARGEGEPDLRCIRSEIEFARDKLTIGDLK